MDLENVTRLLHPGEQILWASMSKPGKLIDCENRMRNLRWFFTVGAVFTLLMFLYIRACIHAGRSIFSVVSVIFVLMAVVIFLDPITTFRKLKKVEYAITTERVIVCASKTSSFSLPLSKAAPVQFISRSFGAFHHRERQGCSPPGFLPRS